MAGIRFWQVDAFTDRPFGGNPAAVCLLDQPMDGAWMQAVAAEMNLSETAFIRPLAEGFELRWFTPAVEVDLCGHATLAAAHVLWQRDLVPENKVIDFQTRSGTLRASCSSQLIELDFPATPASAVEPPDGLLESLSVEPVFVGRTSFDLLVEVESASTVRGLQPDYARLGRLSTRGVIVTARADAPGFDFISRFFAPAAGVNEDPVTGSAHCCLGPYWSERFGRSQLVGYQASMRGGTVNVRIAGDRVILGGIAIIVCEGNLLV